jgi:hypothetical protein
MPFFRVTVTDFLSSEIAGALSASAGTASPLGGLGA